MPSFGQFMRATFDRRFWRGFEEVVKRSKSTDAALRKLKPVLEADLAEHASSEYSPDGPWAARKRGRADHRRPTVRRGRKRKAGKTVGARQSFSYAGGSQLLGQLPDLTKTRVRRGELVARNPVPWSGVHNDPPGARVGRGAFVPARPFVFLSPEFTARAEKDLLDHVTGGWSKR